MHKVWVIVDKEWAETVRNKLLLFSIGLPPILFVALSLFVLAMTGRGKMKPEEVKGFAHFLPGFDPTEIFQTVMVNQFLTLYLIMPLFIPMTIAAFSIIGEKERRSLEPLLATPIQTWELLMGKVVAAVVPAVLATWLSFGIFCALAPLFVISDKVYKVIVSPMWLLAMGVLAPLFALLSVELGVIISSRVNDTRVAQQLSGLVVIPLIALGIAQTTGKIFFGWQSFLVASLLIAVIDGALLWLAVRLFGRETILVRWRW